MVQVLTIHFPQGNTHFRDDNTYVVKGCSDSYFINNGSCSQALNTILKMAFEYKMSSIMYSVCDYIGYSFRHIFLQHTC